MIKKLIKFTLISATILIIIIFYLSFFGISTNKLNNKIKNEILNINKNINLELKSVKLLLNPFDFTINVKTFGSNILFDNNKIELENIITNISLKSLLNNQFSIDDLQISTKVINLKDLIRLARSFENSTELFILERIIKDGFLIGDIHLNFDSSGKVKDDYEIKGFIKNGKIDILKKKNIENLNLLFSIKNNNYRLEDINLELNQIKFLSPLIAIKKKNNQFLIDGKLISNKKDIDIKFLNSFLGDFLSNFDIKNITFSSVNDFTFSVDNKLKISDLSITSIINLNTLDYKNDSLSIKKYLPNFQELIKLENHKILIDYTKNQLNINGKGDITIEDKSDNIDYKLTRKNNEYNFNTNIFINKNPLLFGGLKYKKKQNLEALFNIKGIYKNNKEIQLNSISLVDSEKNSFLIKGLYLNDQLKIYEINSLSFDFMNSNKIKNQIFLTKNKKNYNITGKSFDASTLLDKLLNNEDDNEDLSLFVKLNSVISIKIVKTYLDNTTFLNSLTGNIVFRNNKINKVKLDSSFFNNKKISLTINVNDNNEKITTLFSGYPKPLLKEYKFIKGFEEGILDFYSIKKDKVSNSILTIDNFKVQEVPVLAKLLTLASLQGIADLLTGEGIRFTDFEMKFSNQKGLMNIEEMYAIGPAISILMDGYIERKNLISLRGTLVPATTINRSIASIPLIGKILVGKKTGEGVFGVSFKIKGQPKNLKTTVNPIKTLTPRFITRTLEKIKKN
jgi:hypothetical protein